jgi:hydroxypyruvate reductase
MRRVRMLEPHDLCIALISGGGSALLPLPVDGITLADKLAVTRFLSSAGAPIEELNTVRKQLSAIKGGGLARACRGGQLVTLIISDILGDPLDLIASGPTVPGNASPGDALEILERYGARAARVAPHALALLTERASNPVARPTLATCDVTNLVIGNNAVAVKAAVDEASRRGYRASEHLAQASEGPAEEIGRQLAERALQMRDAPGPNCLVSGGEPTVKLVAAKHRGLGGRNQQLVLAGVEVLAAAPQGILLLSGGTDGEDGPTDAAGAWVDASLIAEAQRKGLDPRAYLERNDAYHWFEPLGGLLHTGPTDTNVCDVRVVLTENP